MRILRSPRRRVVLPEVHPSRSDTRHGDYLIISRTEQYLLARLSKSRRCDVTHENHPPPTQWERVKNRALQAMPAQQGA